MYCSPLSSNNCMAPSHKSNQLYYVVFPFANRCGTWNSSFTQNLAVLGLLGLCRVLEGGVDTYHKRTTNLAVSRPFGPLQGLTWKLAYTNHVSWDYGGHREGSNTDTINFYVINFVITTCRPLVTLVGTGRDQNSDTINTLLNPLSNTLLNTCFKTL